MPRQFVVRFKRHEVKSPEFRWLSPGPAEQVVVHAENLPMAVRQFYRDHAAETASLTLLEVFEEQGRSSVAVDEDFFRRE